jgi:adenosylhomocysteinase
MVHLVAALGNPIEAMDLGLTLQARSLAAVARGAVESGVHGVPEHTDLRVARDFLAARTG